MKALLILAFTLCGVAAFAAVKNESWGTADGKPVSLWTLSSSSLTVTITNYGGRVVSIIVPDRKGSQADVALGFDDLKGYLGDNPYFGAIVGRYANRIAKGRFTLDGKTYSLAVNNGPNSLHGGIKGFDKRVWDGQESEDTSGQHLRLHYVSADGEEGYPGKLDVIVTYTVKDNDLKIEYEAKTDKDTVLNLSNHTYFNLAGEGVGAGELLKHMITIHASRFTPVDETLIPTGELKPVAGTPFDFTSPRTIAPGIDRKDQQLTFGKGYDHNFVLDLKKSEVRLAASVLDPASGRVMEVFTDQPGLQFYTGNFLDGTVKGKHGHAYPHRGAFCMETQHFPDSPNHPTFPTTELKPGQTFHSTTIYRFSVEK